MSGEGSNQAIKNIVREVNEALECDESPDRVNKDLKICLLNINSLNHLSEDPKRLLANIKRTLIDSPADSKLDFDLLLELLNSVISLCSFEDVLNTFSIEDLILSLKSGVLPLIKAACKVVSKSYPKGLFANSELFDTMLELYFDPNTEISVVNDIEKALSELSSDELVRRRILENNLPLLFAVRKNFDATLFARLLELLAVQLEFIDRNEFNEKLFVLKSDEIFRCLDQDIVLFIHILVYYNNLLKEAQNVKLAIQSHEWMLKYVIDELPTFGKIYYEREKYSDVKYFGKTYLFRLFRSVSYLDDDCYFRTLDRDFIKLSEENEFLKDFLSFINPSYLFQYYPDLLKQYVSLTPSKLGVLRNLLSSRKCFDLIKNKITAEAVLSMPYMEQMVLLQRVSQFLYSVQYLVQSLPKVMSNLIQHQNGDVIESETVALRRETIVNLLRFDRSELNIWYVPLADELAKINGFSKKFTQTEVASSFNQ